MAAGVFGYMGYDTVRLFEHLPNVRRDDLGVPDSVLMRPTLVVIFDSVKDEISLVTPVRPEVTSIFSGWQERFRPPVDHFVLRGQLASKLVDRLVDTQIAQERHALPAR